MIWKRLGHRFSLKMRDRKEMFNIIGLKFVLFLMNFFIIFFYYFNSSQEMNDPLFFRMDTVAIPQPKVFFCHTQTPEWQDYLPHLLLRVVLFSKV